MDVWTRQPLAVIALSVCIANEAVYWVSKDENVGIRPRVVISHPRAP